MRRPLVHLLSAAIIAALPFSAGAALKTAPNKYVRTANYYLKAGELIRPQDYPVLAQYDMLVFPAEAQLYNKGMFAELRRRNPSILILAYVSSKSFNFDYWTDPLHQKLLKKIDDSWWLRDSQGGIMSVWQGTQTVSGASPWNTVLPQFLKDDVMATGLWDGVFLDEFSATISWLNGGDIDLHGDGVQDDPEILDAAWQQGMVTMLRTARQLLGPDAIIITNGDSRQAFSPHVNGRMFETFPTPWEGAGRWQDSMANYLGDQAQVGHDPVFIINSNTSNTGDRFNYRHMRLGIASTLMGSGYFSFDYGEQDHGQLWHYDEEDVALGRPLGRPINLLAPSDSRVRDSVWRRDFEQGVAIVNATGTTQTVRFQEELEKIRGTQATDINDGSVVTSVTLAPKDGIILRKRLSRIVGGGFINGAFASVYGSGGQKLRNGFFASNPSAIGQATSLSDDLDGDGRLEHIVAGSTRVHVFGDDGRLRTSFSPYGSAYGSGVTLAAGDLDGDGKKEIVTGTGLGGAPRVRAFTMSGQATETDFFAYSSAFRGGVNVAVYDLYQNGKGVIVTGAGPGGGPHVRVFNRLGSLIAQFFAYGEGFRGGVRVAAGDVDGDGQTEIVTGAGPGGGPHVRVFSSLGAPKGPGFFSGDPNSRSGVWVAVGDTDDNGIAEIIALTTDAFIGR